MRVLLIQEKISEFKLYGKSIQSGYSGAGLGGQKHGLVFSEKSVRRDTAVPAARTVG
ncbi:MAG: hypothetical protein FWG35_06290 [Spirochaetaceae bacterium]|nr:hypothetical protein [Spirochaetaceae bacterium]